MSAQSRTIRLTPDAGSTQLAYDFPVREAAEVTVRRFRGGAVTTLGVDSDYSILLGSAGGTVILAAATQEDDEYEIDGATPASRISDYDPNQTPSGDQIDADLDRLTAIAAEQARDLARIAPPLPRASSLAGFDAAGAPAAYGLAALLNGNFDARGPLAGRDAYDGEAEGFTYLAIDTAPLAFYVRAGATWSGPHYFGFPAVGAAGLNLLAAASIAGAADYLDDAWPFNQIVRHAARLAALEAAQDLGLVVAPGWTELAAITSLPTGSGAWVIDGAGSTHTDPVTAATVPDQGLYSYVSPTGWQWLAADLPLTPRDGEIPYGHTTAGLTLVKDIDGKSLVTFDPVAGQTVIDGDRAPFGQVRVIILYGQSNMSVGTSTPARMPAIHSAALHPKRFWMLDACTLEGLQNTDIATLDLRRAVPGRETNSETYASAMISQIIAYEDALGLPPAAYAVVNVARASATYNQIKKPTNPYNNAIAAVTALKKIFGQVTVFAVAGDHGEDNSADSAATYKAYKQEIYDDWNADLCAVTGQTGPIPFFLVQVPTLSTNGLGQGVQDAIVSLHQDAVALPANRRIYAACPRYQVGYGDELHVASLGGVKIGALLGQAIAETLYGSGHSPVYMTGASAAAGVITVTTSAAFALEEGSTPAGTPTGTVKGFIVTDAGGTPRTVNSASAVGTTIQLAVPGAAAGDKVKYARTDINASAVGPGGWGNFRDSRPTKAAVNPLFDCKQWLMAGEATVS